jgi:hypothetical protein
MGTLACVTSGFEVAARHPVLIILPLLLDMFLWLGPRLSVAPLLRGFRSSMNEVLPAGVMVSEAADAYALVGRILEEVGQSFNLFSLLHPAPLLGVPVLMPARMSALSPLGNQPAIEVRSLLVLLAYVVLMTLAGLGLSAFYLTVVGREVIVETEAPLPGPSSPWGIWGQLVKLGLVLFALLFSLSLAFSLFASLVGLISLSLAGLAMTLAASVMLFIAVHLLFAVPGIVQLRRGALRAMQESLLLTRGDFMNVVFLLGLIFVISRGLSVVWTLPAPDSWATFVGLAGHAFVSTALTAGLLIFYQERLQYLRALQNLYAAQVARQRAAEEATIHPVVSE